ncbi:MAG: hypothetical protein H7210_03215 [Pyrinomonadaceae bacterium]|nr:hypothetical protein [Phycisphaerales bacterium]
MFQLFYGVSRRRLGAVLTAGALALAAMAPSAAFAQGGGPGGGGPGGGRGGMFGGMNQAFDPSVSSQDIDTFTKLFDLDKDQKDAVKQLFDGYQQQFAASAKDVRSKVDAARQEAQESGDRGAFGDIMAQVTEFRKVKSKMEESFFSDMKVVLSEQQLEKWPSFERTRRRQSTISNGLMSGERVDLVKLVDDLKLPAESRTGLSEILDQYALELDPVLVNRNTVYEEFQGKMRELFSGGDQGAMEEAVKKGREASLKVRDTNRKFAAQIEPALPDSSREAFVSAFKRESFPQVYRQSATGRDVEAALKLEGLNDDQKSAIGTIRDDYNRELVRIQKDMEAATEESEMNFSPGNFMRGGGRGGPGGGEDDNLGKIRRKRREMEKEVGEKVLALLTEEQREKLPKRDAGGNNDGGGRGDRQGGAGNNADNNAGGGNRRQRAPGRNE